MTSQMVMYDEEFRRISAVCHGLCRAANARVVYVVDKNGQLMASSGEVDQVDSTSVAALVAGEIAATGGLAKLMGEKEFRTLFHEGVRDSIHISIIGERLILVVIFDSRSSPGLVRLRVRKSAEELNSILDALLERTKNSGEQTPFAEITDDDIDNLFSS